MQKIAGLVLSFLILSMLGFAPNPGIAQVDLLEKISPLLLNATKNSAEVDFLAVFTTQADSASAAQAAPDNSHRAQAVYDSLRAAMPAQQSALQLLANADVKARSFWLINAVAARGSRALLLELAALPEVAYIAADLPFSVSLEEPTSTPVVNSPQAIEWNLTWVHAPQVWSQGITGTGMVYANADTGIQWDHPALINQYRGWNGLASNHNYNWWDAIHNDISGNGTNPCGFSSPIPCDDYGHGTHTVGIGVGGVDVNQIGVAPNARWIGCRNMEQGVGRPSTYLECLEFFLAPWDQNQLNPNPALHADVISNSYTCPPISEFCDARVFAPAISNLRSAGIFFSASAGNYGSACGTIMYPPATEPLAFTVGGTGTGYNSNTHLINPQSSRGPALVSGSLVRKPDLVAPGFSVNSSYPGNTYAILGGTSMSAPHVAGAVALLWSAYPALRGNVPLTESILRNSAFPLPPESLCGDDSIGSVPNNTYGFGELDIWQAYLKTPLIFSRLNANLPLLFSFFTVP